MQRIFLLVCLNDLYYIKINNIIFIFYFFIIMDENDALSEYNKIPLGRNRANGVVYSKIYFKDEICSAH